MTINIVARPTEAGDRLALLRADLDDLVNAGDQVAPMILDNLAWLAAMEDAGLVVDLATGLPVALDVDRASRPNLKGAP